MSGLDKVGDSLDEVGKRVEALRGAKVEINAKGAIGDLAEVGTAAKDAASAVDAMGGTRVDVSAEGAISSLQTVAVAAKEANTAIIAAGGVVFGLNATDAIAGLTAVRQEAQDAVSAITAASGARFDVNTSQAIASLTQVAVAADNVAAQLQAADGATLAINVTRDQLDAASRAVQELRQTTGQTMTATVSISGLGELEAATSEAVRTREAIGDIADAAPNVSLGGLNADLNQAAASAQQLVATLQGLGSIGLGAGFAGLLVAPMVQGIQTAAQLEQSLKNVQVALGDVSNADLSRLDSSIRAVGTSTEFSAKQISEVAESLAKAGNDVSDILDGQMLPAVANLASATGSDLQTAVTGVVQAMSVWGPTMVDASIAMTDASKAADVLTIAANQSSADIDDIIMGMRSLGPVASQVGVSFDEAAAAIAMFTNAGLTGADAGNSIARGIQNLNNATSEGRALLDQLGISVFDVQGKFVGLESLFSQLSSALQGMSQQQQQAAISTLFGAEAQDVFALAVASGVDPLRNIVAAMQEQGVAADQAFEKTQTLSGAWERLQEATSTALGGIAGGFVEPLTLIASGIDVVVSAVSALPAPIQQASGLLTGFAGIAIAAVTSVNLIAAAYGKFGAAVGNVTGISQAVSVLQRLVQWARTAQVSLLGMQVAAGPLLLGITAIAAGVGLLYYAFQRNKAEARELAEAWDAAGKSMADLNKNVMQMALTGNASGATWAGGLLAKTTSFFDQYRAQVESFINDLEHGKYLTDMEGASRQFAQIFADAFSGGHIEIADAFIDKADIISWANKTLNDPALQQSVGSALSDLFSLSGNQYVDQDRLQKETTAILTEMFTTNNIPKGISDLNALYADLAEGAEKAGEAMKQLKQDFRLDDLKIQGKFELAQQLEDVNTELDHLAMNWRKVNLSGDKLNALSPMDQAAVFEHNNAAMQMSIELSDQYSAAQQRITEAVASGSLANGKVIDDLAAINQARLVNIANGMDEAEANELAAKAVIAMSTGLSEYTNQLTSAQQAAIAFSTSSDGVLAFFQQLQRTRASLSGSPITDADSAVGLLGFNVDRAGKALDRVLQTYERIEALGSRSSKASSIAETLIGNTDEVGKLPELMDRIAAGTSRATLSQQEYTQAMGAGQAIIQSNVQVQDMLTSIQAKQLPALAAQQKGYEAAISSLEKMNAADQRRVLMLTDSNVQQQLAAVGQLQLQGAYTATTQAMADQIATQALLNPEVAEALKLYDSLRVSADGYYQVLGGNGQWVTTNIRAITDAVTDQAQQAEAATGSWEAWVQEAAAAGMTAEDLQKNLTDLRSTIVDISGIGESLAGIQMAGLATEATQLAAHLIQAGQALDSTFRVVVTNTNQMKQSFQQLYDWGEKLIGPEGTWTRMDELLDKGLITGEHGIFTGDTQYAQAQQAFNAISKLNDEVADYVDAIQVNLAHGLAEAAERQKTWIQGLYEQDAATQLATLGWADQTEAARAYSLVMMAADAAAGKYGETGIQMAEQAILAAANMDPVIAAMLENLGLIEQAADGSYVVHLDAVDNASGTIDDLNDSLKILTLLLAGVPPAKIKAEVEGKGDVDDLYDALLGLPPETTVDVKVSMVYPGGSDNGLAIGGGDLSIWGPGGKKGPPAITVPAQLETITSPPEYTGGAVTVQANVVFSGPTASQGDGTGGPLAGMTPGQQEYVIRAVVGDVDTSAIDNLPPKTVTIGGDVTLLLAAVSNGNEATASMPDKTVQLWGDVTILLAAAANGTDAVNGIPDRTIAIDGDASGALGAISDVTNALANMPSGKTITISYVTDGAQPLAKGGVVRGHGNSVVARLAERGPELYRTPQGRWGLARTDGLYPMVPGSYVYTAGKTKSMLRRWDGPAYARGGRVATPTASAQRGTTNSVTNNTHEYRIAPNVTITGVSDADMNYVTEQVSSAIVTAVQTRRFSKGGS